tara:strand:+ start:17123 stop:17461 length:339 start_codon:yes stop_codon:yes gene_type:complete
MMDKQVEEYIALESDSLPHLTKWGFTFESVEITCSKCGKPTVDNKYRFIDYDKVTRVIGFGVCWDCNIVIKAEPMQLYDDGRYLVKKTDGWVELNWKTERKWLMKIKSWFKK